MANLEADIAALEKLTANATPDASRTELWRLLVLYRQHLDLESWSCFGLPGPRVRSPGDHRVSVVVPTAGERHEGDRTGVYRGGGRAGPAALHGLRNLR